MMLITMVVMITILNDVDLDYNADDIDDVGTRYSGRVSDAGSVDGEYKYNYKKMFINLDICEKFHMEISVNK